MGVGGRRNRGIGEGEGGTRKSIQILRFEYAKVDPQYRIVVAVATIASRQIWHNCRKDLASRVKRSKSFDYI